MDSGEEETTKEQWKDERKRNSLSLRNSPRQFKDSKTATDNVFHFFVLYSVLFGMRRKLFT